MSTTANLDSFALVMAMANYSTPALHTPSASAMLCRLGAPLCDGAVSTRPDSGTTQPALYVKAHAMDSFGREFCQCDLSARKEMPGTQKVSTPCLSLGTGSPRLLLQGNTGPACTAALHSSAPAPDGS